MGVDFLFGQGNGQGKNKDNNTFFIFTDCHLRIKNGNLFNTMLYNCFDYVLSCPLSQYDVIFIDFT